MSGRSTAQWSVLAAFGIAAAALLLMATGPGLDDEGPSVGQGRTVYLFQSYDCIACWDQVTQGGRSELINISQEAGLQIIWKNVSPRSDYGAAMAHCVWQVFPDRFLEWDRIAFEMQPYPGYGWPREEGTLYAAESRLELGHQATRAIESCFHDPPTKQIKDDTAFWQEERYPLPALYIDGAWHRGDPEGLRGALASS